MMIFWSIVDAATGKLEIVEAYHTMEDAIRDLALLAWEEPSNRRAAFLLDENKREAVAVTIFGPEGELLVTTADGRRLTFERLEPGVERE